MTEGLGLPDLLRRLRAEILESQENAKHDSSGPFFEVTEVALEAHVVVTERDQANGGFDIKVVAMGGEAELQRERLHKVTLTLKPRAHFDTRGLLIANNIPRSATDPISVVDVIRDIDS